RRRFSTLDGSAMSPSPSIAGEATLAPGEGAHKGLPAVRWSPRRPSVPAAGEGEAETKADHDEAAGPADEGEAPRRPAEPGPRRSGEERPDAVADQGDHH